MLDLLLRTAVSPFTRYPSSPQKARPKNALQFP